ncbi:MAG: DNA-processing protein DprA [Actinomycetaceae bacterium]|nr:DNA-processing protein DprA [Actinomycetaceae bacterium]
MEPTMHHIDLTDPRDVACAWSAIVEPGDEAAAILREHLGAAEALEWLLAHPDPTALPRALRVNAQGEPRPWVRAIERWMPRIDSLNVQRDLEILSKVDGHVLYPGHPHWPKELNDLGLGTPPALWIRGTIGDSPRIGIVGARAASAMGTSIARDFAWELARDGIDIVSGGAFGIDAAAHRGALTQGRTIALMAGGVANLYPIAHLDLFDDIIENGAIISESPPLWRPARWRFLARNRLIAALSHACIVVEANSRSGALATIRRAIDLNRPVGAVPGPITSQTSSGCHHIIRQGATLISSATEARELIDDVGAHLFDLDQPNISGGSEAWRSLNATQKRIWDALPAKAATTAVKIARIAGLSCHEVTSELATLTVKGLIRIDGEHIRRA